jgi:hypothetical protein
MEGLSVNMIKSNRYFIFFTSIMLIVYVIQVLSPLRLNNDSSIFLMMADNYLTRGDFKYN